MPFPALILVFLKKFSQNMAIDQLGMIYGKIKIVEINFFPARSDRVMN